MELPEFKLIESDRNGDSFILTKPYSFTYGGKECTVPEGFRCDGVSTPPFLWGLVSPKIDSRTIKAGVTHDYIYRYQPEGWTRGEADNMFYSFCREGGLGIIKSVLAWVGLRLFGGGAWLMDKHRTCPGCSMDCSSCYRYKGNR